MIATGAPADRSETGDADTDRAASTATLRGRCVDSSTGNPLPKCSVEFHGWPHPDRFDGSIAAHRRSHVRWRRPPSQTTGSDGVFTLVFPPAPLFRFRLEIRGPGTVPLSRQWEALSPGRALDLGDIPIQRGSTVNGTVVDSKGVSQDGVKIRIGRDPGQPGQHRLRSALSHEAIARDDGTFTFTDPLAPGTWRLDIPDRQVIAPETLEVPEGEPFHFFVIETRPIADVPQVSGRVVDQEGRPVWEVEVFLSHTPGARRANTDSDGRFVINQRKRESEGPFRLAFSRPGLEDLNPEELLAWGSTGLEFVMQRGLAVSIVVIDAETNQPIEENGVRCFPVPGSRYRQDSADMDLVADWSHPTGRLKFYGLPRGPYILVVEPAGDRWQRSGFLRFEVSDHGAPEQWVRLHPIVSRTVRVVHAAGEPVEGTEVQLLRPIGTVPVSLGTPESNANELSIGMERIGWKWRADLAESIAKGRTDADGELLLRGPPRTPLVLRVLGPGHAPFVVPDVVLAVDAEPLVITAPLGATVEGRIGPAELLDWFLPDAAATTRAGDRPKARLGRFADSWPGVILRRESGGADLAHPAKGHAARLLLDEDGRFVIGCVPPGTWDLHFAFRVRDGSKTYATEFVTTISDLEDGEVREVAADLRHLKPARITGKVVMNGMPLEVGRVTLIGKYVGARNRQERIAYNGIELGPGGTFVVDARAATYRLQVRLPSLPRSLPAAEGITVRLGQEVDQAFHVGAGGLRIRIVDPSVKAVPGIEVRLTDLDGNFLAQTPATDGRGRAALDVVPAGALVFSVVPKALTDPAARMALERANPKNPNAWQEAMVRLGQATVTAGSTPTAVELVMPASAGY